jgi:hypothetical protein
MHTTNVRQRRTSHFAARIINGHAYPARTTDEIHFPNWDDLAVGQSVRANYNGNTNWGVFILKLDAKRKRALIMEATNLRRWIDHGNIRLVFGNNLPDISTEGTTPATHHHTV